MTVPAAMICVPTMDAHQGRLAAAGRAEQPVIVPRAICTEMFVHREAAYRG